jgi:hypothetical protein
MKTEDSSVHLGSSSESMRLRSAPALMGARAVEPVDVEAFFEQIEYAVLSRMYSGDDGQIMAAKAKLHLYMSQRGALRAINADLTAALQTIVREDPNGYYAAIASKALAGVEQ